MALNIIAAEQSNSTKATAKAVTQLLNYADTHSEYITRYHASDMILHINNDALLLSDPGEKSRAGGCYYLSMASADPNKDPIKQPPRNGPVHAKCTTMKIS